MKLLLISGHGASDPGACSSYGIEREETRKVVNEMVSQLKAYNVDVTVYPQNRNCYADVCNGTVQVNFGSFDYVFEVHFNSATASARGTEVWVTPAEAAIEVEQKIVNKLAACGFTNRGVKRERFAVINYAKNKGVSSALVEVCFISNSADMNNYRAKFSQVCSAMVSGIVEGFGISKKPTAQKPATPAPKPTPAPAKELYRIRKSWADVASQKNAYHNLNSAIAECKKYPGYNVYNSSGAIVFSNPATFKVRIVNAAIYVIDAPNPTTSNIVTTVYKGEVFTIVKVSGNYGYLKSGAGWINLNYTQRI